MIKPKVLISKCIEFESCRWNGLKISSPIVRSFIPYMDFITVCPEVEIGLGVPRDPIRLMNKDGKIHLVKSASGEDHTKQMEYFAGNYFNNLEQFQGMILKSRSPSCGMSNVKVYLPNGNVLSGKGVGMFARTALSKRPLTVVEDESRLLNLRLREHFLCKLFTIHRLTAIDRNMGSLVEFHSQHKYLFMAYSQKKLKDAGSIVANGKAASFDKIYDEYYEKVVDIMANVPRSSSYINVLQHLFGYFSRRYLNNEEKTLFLDMLDRYKRFQVPLVALTSIIQVWIAKYETEYLKKQVLLQPYPKELQTIFDTGKGRMEKFDQS